ncbi:MAG: hypothetical protein IT383_08670 [Deltaproteobacteria bacterium]|nr:hypothetical protein [Deltaproteobacteria bacterium]
MIATTPRSLTMVLLLAAAPAAAAGIDVVTQDLAVDMSTSVLRVEIDAVVEVEGYDSFPIYGLIAPALELRVNGAPATLRADDDYGALVQWLEAPDAGEGPWSVHVVLEGTPSCRSQLNPALDACTFTSDERVLLPGEPGAAWYLMNLSGTDPFTGSVTLRTDPELHAAAGQGAPLVDEEPGDGSRVRRFAIDTPTETLGAWARRGTAFEVDVASGKRVVVAAPSEAAAEPLQRTALTMARVLPRYEALFGALPFDEVHVLPVSGRFPFGGMGLLGNVLLGDFITWPDFDYLIVQGAAHELAHSWWGGLASSGEYVGGGFLQEAFAEYSAWRALGETAAENGEDGAAVRLAGVRMNAVWYLTQTDPAAELAILDEELYDQQDVYVLVTYHKGSVVLRALEEKVGQEVFSAALAGMIARGPSGLSVDVLVEEVAAAGGGDITGDVDQWLRQPGHPVLRAGVSEGALSLEVEGDYQLHVPVRAHFADGTVQESSLEASSGDNALALGARPVLVEVDPHWTMPRVVTPTVPGDVSLDGRVDAVDLMEVALRAGGRVPDERRRDGAYDPLYDVTADGAIDEEDLAAVREP